MAFRKSLERRSRALSIYLYSRYRLRLKPQSRTLPKHGNIEFWFWSQAPSRNLVSLGTTVSEGGAQIPAAHHSALEASSPQHGESCPIFTGMLESENIPVFEKVGQSLAAVGPLSSKGTRFLWLWF